MQSQHYFEIKHRAIELLRGGFEGKTYDEIKSGESWYRTLAIQQILTNAVNEIQTREQDWLIENGKRTVLLLVSDIRRFMLKEDST